MGPQPVFGVKISRLDIDCCSHLPMWQEIPHWQDAGSKNMIA